MIWILLACGTEPAPAPAPTENPSAMRDALRGIQSGETPDATPTDREPPVVPDEARREAPVAAEAVAEDPAECAAAKAERESVEARIYQARASSIDQDEDRIARVQAEMQACIHDPECASDGDRVAKLSNALTASETSYASGFERVAALEAELFQIDKKIAGACGLPGR
ncbi:MAG: hypothetical protein GY913_15995 [Proteobacteria bacterium]|nr:hypothetical protein [Pseudomonadota bacterium]MCP4918407.1 hypothetical protein [Pseudomonadota bacterium]